MVNAAGLVARLIKLQVQEQAGNSFGAPPDYEGRITLDPILLDVERLEAALETGVFELSNSWVHQNLVLHHLGGSMHHSAVLLRELCRMVGSPYCPTNLHEISWRDLQQAEIKQRASPTLVREEIVEDKAGVISSVIVPTLASVPEDAMESEEEELEGSTGALDN